MLRRLHPLVNMLVDVASSAPMNNLKQRAFWTLLQNAVFSPISAVIVVVSILLVGLGVTIPIINASPFFWLIGLVPLWMLAIGMNVVNKQAGVIAASQVFREQYDINRITNPHMRTVITQAIAYRQRIDRVVEQSPSTTSRGRLEDVANRVEDWVGRIYTLARRLDEYRNDSIISADINNVPQSIRILQEHLTMQDDTAVKQEMQDTISRRQGQHSSLRNLDTRMDRAELQLENTLTALGTVYSQMLLLDARDVDSAKTQRLRDSITDQVNSLQDIQISLDEVYQTGGTKSPEY